MLINALIFTSVVALCAGAVLEGTLALGRISARHAAAHYAELGLAQARVALVAAVAGQIARGATTLVAPGPLAAVSACRSGATRCPFTVSASFALSGETGNAGGSNATALDMQTHPAIGEGRVAATIVETVASNAGVPLAVRTYDVTLRTFAVPPYAAIDGTSDAAATRDAPSEADAAGCDPLQPRACDRNYAGTGSQPADTRIHALSRCIDGGSGACNGQSFVSVDPTSSPATEWYNANANGEPWSR